MMSVHGLSVVCPQVQPLLVVVLCIHVICYIFKLAMFDDVKTSGERLRPRGNI